MFVEREVRHQPFQPTVLFFQLPETPQFAHSEVGVLLFPRIEGGLAHAQLSAQVAHGGAGFGLSDGVDDLLLRESEGAPVIRTVC